MHAEMKWITWWLSLPFDLNVLWVIKNILGTSNDLWSRTNLRELKSHRLHSSSHPVTLCFVTIERKYFNLISPLQMYCSYFVVGSVNIFLTVPFWFSLCLSYCSTFVCPTEIISFSDKANEFHDVNCEVVGVSVDSHFTHLAWINTPRKVLSSLLVVIH